MLHFHLVCLPYEAAGAGVTHAHCLWQDQMSSNFHAIYLYIIVTPAVPERIPKNLINILVECIYLVLQFFPGNVHVQNLLLK